VLAAPIPRADDFDSDTVDALQHLAAGDEGTDQNIRERLVVGDHLAQAVALDLDVAHRLGDDRGQVDGLPREQIHLSEEAAGAVADDLVAGGIDDRRLPLEHRDERVGLVADAVEHVADRGGALLPVCEQRLELSGGQDRPGGGRSDGHDSIGDGGIRVCP